MKRKAPTDASNFIYTHRDEQAAAGCAAWPAADAPPPVLPPDGRIKAEAFTAPLLHSSAVFTLQLICGHANVLRAGD